MSVYCIFSHCHCIICFTCMHVLWCCSRLCTTILCFSFSISLAHINVRFFHHIILPHSFYIFALFYLHLSTTFSHTSLHLCALDIYLFILISLGCSTLVNTIAYLILSILFLIFLLCLHTTSSTTIIDSCINTYTFHVYIVFCIIL